MRRRGISLYPPWRRARLRTRASAICSLRPKMTSARLRTARSNADTSVRVVGVTSTGSNCGNAAAASTGAATVGSGVACRPCRSSLRTGRSTRRFSGKGGGRAALLAQLAQLGMPGGVSIRQVDDAHFLALTEPPGPPAGLIEHEEVERHLHPQNSIDATLEVQPLIDAPVRDDHHMVPLLHRLQNGLLAIFGSDAVGQRPGLHVREYPLEPSASRAEIVLVDIQHDAPSLAEFPLHQRDKAPL